MSHQAVLGVKKLWKHAVTATSATDDEMVGALRIDGEYIYRWIMNESGDAFVAGGACFHTFSNGADAHTLCTDGVTADLGFFAGIAMSAIPDDEFGFIMVHGYYAAVLVTTAGGAITAGDPLIGVNGSDDMIGGTTMGTAPIYSRTAIAMEAMATTSTATTIKAFVQALG